MGNEMEDLLERYRQGDREALDQLFIKLEPNLRLLAHLYLRGERPDATLRSTALLHELFIWLRTRLQMKTMNYADVSHFLGTLAWQLQNIVRDTVRKRIRKKRGGDKIRVPLDKGDIVDDDFARFESLDRALTVLREEDARAHQVFICRYRIGLTTQEIADLSGTSSATMFRDLEFAKSFLKNQIGREEPPLRMRFVLKSTEDG